MSSVIKKSLLNIATSLALVASSIVVTAATATPAHAVPSGPACRPGGVHVVFARGSGAKLFADEFSSFVHELAQQQTAIKPKVNFTFMELGNFDNNRRSGQNPEKPTEYPALGPTNWSNIHGVMDKYGKSVRVGTDELVAYLNARVKRPGCNKEATILGGFSQGADVVGWALQRTGTHGWALDPQVRSQIAYVAFYGDPRANRVYKKDNRCFLHAWTRGDATQCSNGILRGRNPYLPSYMARRSGSWCDHGDGICRNGWVGSHTTAYPKTWIPRSAREVASAGIDKATRLHPVHGPLRGAASINTSTLKRGMVLRGGQYIRSRNRACTLTMQPDGNMVLRRGSAVLWSAGTSQRYGAHLGVNANGTVAVYHNGKAVWARGSYSVSRLVVQDDCNLVAYNAANKAVWATGTEGR